MHLNVVCWDMSLTFVSKACVVIVVYIVAATIHACGRNGRNLVSFEKDIIIFYVTSALCRICNHILLLMACNSWKWMMKMTKSPFGKIHKKIILVCMLFILCLLKLNLLLWHLCSYLIIANLSWCVCRIMKEAISPPSLMVLQFTDR